MDTRLLIRLVLPTAAVGLLLLAVGLLAGWYVHRLQREVATVLKVNVASVRAAERLEITVRKIQTALHQHWATGRPTSPHLGQLALLASEASEWMDEVERLATTPQEQGLVSRARAGFTLIRPALDQTGGPNPVDPAEVIGERGELDRTIEAHILPHVHTYLELNEAAAADALRENQEVADRLGAALVMLATCGCTAGLLTGFGLARGVARSLVQLSVPVRDAAGKLGRVVGPITVSSVTRFADLDRTLQQLAAEVGTVVGRLQEAERAMLRREQLAAIGQLAAGVAHELRNPLTAIKVLVQTAALRPDEPVLRGHNLAVLRAEIDRLEGTIQAFLDFARPPHPEKRPVAVDAVVRDTLALVAARGEQQGVSLTAAVNPVTLEADPGQLRQVVLNLVLNALDATPPGGAVEVRAGADGGWVVVAVSDTGSGLPSDLGERIFEPFVSTKETGTGLGLSICRRVVDAHGGTIAGSSRPEGGAVFTVRLPGPGLLE